MAEDATKAARLGALPCQHIYAVGSMVADGRFNACCHDARTCDTGGLLGFLPVPLAVDATRVARLRAAGYHVVTQTIPEEITPHNRLILGLSAQVGGSDRPWRE